LIALLATALALLAGGLHAIATVLLVDFFHARRPALSQTDDLRLARKLTIVVAAAIAAICIAACQRAESAGALVALGSVLAAPLLAAMLLGMLTRRATSAASFMALLIGSLLALGSTVARRLLPAGIIAVRYRVSEVWIFIAAFAFTVGLGYALSFFLGSRKKKRELRGLVLGCGRLGVPAQDEEIPIIPDPSETAASKG
jgi:Na+/proline symporter